MGDDRHFLAGRQRGQMRGRGRDGFVDGNLPLGGGGHGLYQHIVAGQQIAQRRETAPAGTGEEGPVGAQIGDAHLRALRQAANGGSARIGGGVDGDHIADDGGGFIDAGKAGERILRRLLGGRGRGFTAQIAHQHIAAQAAAGHAGPAAIGAEHIDGRAGAQPLVLAGSAHGAVKIRAVELYARRVGHVFHGLHVRGAGVAGAAGGKIAEIGDAAAVALNGDDLAFGKRADLPREAAVRVYRHGVGGNNGCQARRERRCRQGEQKKHHRQKQWQYSLSHRLFACKYHGLVLLAVLSPMRIRIVLIEGMQYKYDAQAKNPSYLQC